MVLRDTNFVYIDIDNLVKLNELKSKVCVFGELFETFNYWI